MRCGAEVAMKVSPVFLEDSVRADVSVSEVGQFLFCDFGFCYVFVIWIAWCGSCFCVGVRFSFLVIDIQGGR